MAGYSISDLAGIDGRMQVDDGSSVVIEWANYAPTLIPPVARDIYKIDHFEGEGFDLDTYGGMLALSGFEELGVTYSKPDTVHHVSTYIGPRNTISQAGEDASTYTEAIINGGQGLQVNIPIVSDSDATIFTGIDPVEGVLYRVKGDISIGGAPPENTNDVSVFMTGRNNDDNSTRRIAVQESGDFETILQGILPSQKYSVYTLWGDVNDVNAKGGLIRDNISPSAYINGYLNKISASPDMPLTGTYIGGDLITIDFNNEPTIKTFNITSGDNILKLGGIWDLVESSAGYYLEPSTFTCEDKVNSSQLNIAEVDVSMPSYVSLTGGSLLEVSVPTGNMSRVVSEVLHDENIREHSSLDVLVTRYGRFNLADSLRYPIHHKAFDMEPNADVGFGWTIDPSNTITRLYGYSSYYSRGISDVSLRGDVGAAMSASVAGSKNMYVDIPWPFDYCPGLDVNLAWRSISSGYEDRGYVTVSLLDADGDVIHSETKNNSGITDPRFGTYDKIGSNKYIKDYYNTVDWSMKVPMKMNTAVIRITMGVNDTETSPNIAFQGVEMSIVRPTPVQELKHAIKVT